MSIKLPAQMESSWKHYLLNLQFQSVHALEIARHTHIIHQICQPPSHEITTVLNTPDFWEQLSSKTFFDSKVLQLKSLWQKVSPLAHLNAKQLLILLEEEIEPLENAYRLLEIELGDFSDKTERFTAKFILRMQQSKQNIREKINENLELLAKLKKMVHESLLFRCDLSEFWDKPRNVDDIIAAFCTKINSFNVINLALPVILSDSLDDDRRLTIYDTLSHAGFEISDLQKKVLDVIPKRKHSITLSSRQEVIKRLKQVKEFNQSFIKDLNLNGHGQSFLASHFWKKEFFKKLGQALENWGVYPAAQFLWSFRYLFYLFASLVVYHQLIFLCQPFIIATLGISLFNTFSTALFYTLGIAPMWYLGWTVVEDLGLESINLMTRWKKQSVLQALRFIEKVEFFLSAKLHRTIIDLPHFDIQYIVESVERLKAESQSIKENLHTYHFGEKWATKGLLHAKIEEVSKRLDKEQETLKNQLAKVAEHIAKNIGDELELLHQTATENRLEPVMPASQLEQLKNFVNRYGEEKAQHLFETNTNLCAKWLNQLTKNKFVPVVEDNQLKKNATKDNQVHFKPWGGSLIRHDMLRGWHVLLESSMQAPAKKKACLLLNAMLDGRIELSPEKYEETINALELADDHKLEVKRCIGSFLFRTLEARPHQHAALLPEEYKEQIIKWYKVHENEIQEAVSQIDSIMRRARVIPEHAIDELNPLQELNDETLAKYYELLDSQAVCLYAMNELPEKELKIKEVRNYFDSYNGEHSRAYRLLRLIPENERGKLTVQLVEKRLSYLFTNFANGKIRSTAFDQVDVEMFQSFSLPKNNYSFFEFIRKQKIFTGAWDRYFEQFLEACTRKGIPGSDKLFIEYKARTHRQREFIEDLALQSCAQETSVSDSENKRRITVH